MTKRRQLVLDFIRAYIKIHGVSPSYEVIAKGLNMKSRANMHRIVQKLKDGGHVEKRPKKFYGIKLLDKSVREMAAL
jgi:repressor LexA